MSLIKLLLIVLINVGIAINVRCNCPCLSNDSGARWKNMRQILIRCSDENPVIRVMRKCILNNGITIICNYQLNCTADWTEWLNNGTCNALCGYGIQTQTRRCLVLRQEPDPSISIRSSSCTGAIGQHLQTRTQICEQFTENCNSSSDCPCLRNDTGARWTNMRQIVIRCSDKNPVIHVRRKCVLNNGITIICNYQLNCTADWTEWFNNGTCNASCGYGIQTQTRRCLALRQEPDPSIRIHSYSCTGAIGQHLQTRTQTCYQFTENCNSSVLTPAGNINIQLSTTIQTLLLPNSSKQLSTKNLRTTISPGLLSNDNISENFDSEKFNTELNTDNIGTKNDPVNENHLLAYVLGSLALLCFTIIIVVLIVKKKRKPKTILVRQAQFVPSSSLDSENHYAVVAPVLPPRNPTNEISNHPEKICEEPIKLEEDEDGYLKETINPLQAITDEDNYLKLTFDEDKSDQ